MRHLFCVLFLVLTAPAMAGYTPPSQEPMLGSVDLPATGEWKPQCGHASGISNAANVGEYSRILAEKAAKLSGTKSCRFDGDRITVTATGNGFTTTVNDGSALVYTLYREEPNRAVIATWSTWSPPNCPSGTIEGLMNEQLRRVFACYPEPGHQVTTRAEDEAARKAAEETALRWSRLSR